MARRTSASCASATGSTKSCIACHTDKRALFLFEHAAGRESCVSCHDPHGSNNHAMLVARTPMLAQRCHIGTRRPSTIYDGAAIQARSIRIIGRGVVNCHQNIHGSNPSGQALVRIGGAHETAIKCSRRHPPHSAGICIRAGRSGNTGGGGRQYRPRRRCRLGPRATGGLCDVGRFQTFGDPTGGPTLNFDWNQIPTWYSGVSTGCRRFGAAGQQSPLDHVWRRSRAARHGDVRGLLCVRELQHAAALATGNPGAQFNDPTRDWQTDMDENVHTWSLSANAQVANRITGERRPSGSLRLIYRW